MKQRQIILILTFIIINLYSCSDDVTSDTHQEERQNLIAQADDKHPEALNDSINSLRDKVTELTAKLEDVSSKLNEEKPISANRKERKTTEWPLILGCVVGLLISLISLVISLFALKRARKCNDRASRHREEIEYLKQHLNELRSYQNFTAYERLNNSVLSSTYYDKILSRVNYLEKGLSELQSNVAVRRSIQNPHISDIRQTRQIKNGCFGPAISGENGSGYFKKLLDSNNSDARFFAEITDESAEFEPIVSLPNIKSSDYMDLAVEFEGVSKAEATNMSVHYKGLAHRTGDKWIIVKKAVITLKK